MAIFFACLFAVGMVCFWLYTYDLIQGRLTRYTTWKELTTAQWLFFVGSLGIPIGLIGLLIIKYTS